MRSYADPQPGVWEIEVESRRTSPLLDNPYKLDVAVLGAAFDPAVVTVPEAKVGTPAAGLLEGDEQASPRSTAS